MQDLNFFETYTEKSEFTIDKRLILCFLAINLAIILVVYIIINQIKIRQLSRDVDGLQTIVEDERINEKIKEIKEKQIEFTKSSESLEKIRMFNENIENDDIIDTYLLDNITSKIPEDVYFTSISMYIDNIQIVGSSKDKWAIAQLGKGLETVEDFHEIFISNISSEKGYYNFVLNISLRDVNIDEGEAMEEESENKEANGE